MSKFGVHIATWNVGNTKPPEDLSALVGLPESEYVIDILAVGLQEVPWGFWSSADPLSPSNPWLRHLTDVLGKSEFVLLTATQMCGSFLAIFVQRGVLPFVSSIEHAHTPTGLFGLIGTKGVVSIRFQLHGTWFSFVNSHLAAHVWNSMTRIWEYDTILDYHLYPDHSKILDHDYVFWFGDLNFRLEGVAREKIDAVLRAKAYSDLFEFDQLTRFQRDGLIFTDFEESGLYFPPTYKKTIGSSSDYVMCPKRLPSWCDRILYSSTSAPYSIHVLDYADLPSFKMSDHSPVFLQANVAIPHPATNSIVRFGPVSCEPMPTLTNSNRESIIMACTFSFANHFRPSPEDSIALYPKYFARLDSDVQRWSVSEFLPLRAIRLDLVDEIDSRLQTGWYCLVYHHSNGVSTRVTGISDYFAIGEVGSDDEEDFGGDGGGFVNGDESGSSSEIMLDVGGDDDGDEIEGARSQSTTRCRPRSARRQRSSIPPRPKSARGYYDDLSLTPVAASNSGSRNPSIPVTPTAWTSEISAEQELAFQLQENSLNESIALDEELGIQNDEGDGEELVVDDELIEEYDEVEEENN